jgi:hypothetical protein
VSDRFPPISDVCWQINPGHRGTLAAVRQSAHKPLFRKALTGKLATPAGRPFVGQFNGLAMSNPLLGGQAAHRLTLRCLTRFSH